MQSEFTDLQILLNSIPALVAYIDCDMVLRFCNRPFKGWFGINGKPGGQKFQLIAGAEIFNQVQRHLGKVLVGDCAHFEILVNSQNGLQYLEATLSPDFDEFSLVKGFIFHCLDVTEQKLAAKKNKESDERFRQMADLVPLVIWTTDEKGDCNFLNSKWQHLTGKSIEEGLKTLWFSFIHPHDRDKVVNSWTSSFLAHQPFEGKFRLLNASGNYIVAYANATPIFDNGKNVTGYIGILQDISAEEQIKYSLEKMVLDRTEDIRKRNLDLKQAKTVLKKKNEELEKINNKLSSFAHIASHDLQEPLRKIQLNLGKLIALDGENISAEGKDLYQRITDSAGRMKNLIRNLLAFARSSDNKGKLEEVDLNLVLKETINTLDTKIAEKNATIEVEQLPVLTVVPFQFHQLFLNLLSNALKFSRPNTHPYIVVGCELVQGKRVKNVPGEVYKSYYHISVSDNGIGFPPGMSEKIFEMFYRLHGRAKYEGTGLGLAICKKIVENHEGTILADSRENEGSVFHIYLPNKK